MGQKINPVVFRLGSLLTWKSRWYAERKQYSDRVLEDAKIREFLEERLVNAGVAEIHIERSINRVNILLRVARPGVVIGRGGATLRELQEELAARFGNHGVSGKAGNVSLDVIQVEQPDLEAKLVAQRVSDQLKNRYPPRRAVSQALERVMQAGAKGIKIQLSGRINGAEISRREKYRQGSVPSQTTRSDINYAQVPSLTKSGYVGVKVWINRGEKEM